MNHIAPLHVTNIVSVLFKNIFVIFFLIDMARPNIFAKNKD